MASVHDGRMTREQASELKALAEEAYELDAYSDALSQAEASRRIGALKAKLRLQDGPPHPLSDSSCLPRPRRRAFIIC